MDNKGKAELFVAGKRWRSNSCIASEWLYEEGRVLVWMYDGTPVACRHADGVFTYNGNERDLVTANKVAAIKAAYEAATAGMTGTER